MNDLSLGRLRIANPDESSPETPLQPRSSAQSLPKIPAVSPIASPEDQNQVYTRTNLESNYRSVSPVDDPQNLSYPPRAPQPIIDAHPQYVQQRPDRYIQRQSQALPLTYQDQQQAQFPQYPSMMPQNLHDSNQSQGRPGSLYYTHLPVTNTGNGLTRQGSYRREGSSSTSTPQRNVSRKTPQADAPSERAFRPTSLSVGESSVPQRRPSRNINPSRMTSAPSDYTPMSNTPMSMNTPLSASPYAVEGGALANANTEDWQERGAAHGIQRDYDANGQPVVRSIKRGVRDFNFGATLGEGSYSTVLSATDRQTNKEYAIKVLDKRHIIKEKKVKYVNIEKETLNRLTDHPGVVRLYYTFQDERSLYFVLDLCSGGELLGVLKRMTTFDEECTRFYGAQILDTIAYMHSKGVIHRDLKPENVLMDDKRHIKITDFGTAKMLAVHQNPAGRTYYDADTSTDGRANSFVGTAEYVSPELLTDKNACKASDLWAFGCIIYQLLAGRPPFKAANEYLTFQKIVALEYEFPQGFPETARDLVERLLVLDPYQRLSLDNVRNHEFFNGVKWGRGLWQQTAPRLKAYVPPPRPPIRLNGNGNSYSSITGGGNSVQSNMLPPSSTSLQKPSKPRVVTELPPPSQLDIDWSPVLTKSNERILKLGNLNVSMAQGPHSPGNDGGKKLSRFFSGNTTKKRQRLVMVTSSARIIIAAAGGEEKKSKSEIDLLATGTEVMSSMDSKGTTHWKINMRDRNYTFDDVKPPSSTEVDTTALSTKEWLEAVERAREIVKSQNQVRNFQPGEPLTPGDLSHSDAFEDPSELETSPPHSHSSRGVLQKQIVAGDNDSMKGRKRFSKRQSKSGLTAVF